MTININEVADRLIAAKRNGAPVETLIGSGGPGDTRLDALRVAQEVVRRREQAGDRQVGFKLGNIAKAMQDKFQARGYRTIAVAMTYPFSTVQWPSMKCTGVGRTRM